MSVRGATIPLVFLLAFGAGCSGDPGNDGSDEPLGTTAEAADALNDRRVAAAVEVKAHGRRDVWVIACDTDQKLRRLILAGNEWSDEGILDHDCRGVPSIARYPGTNSDAISIYSRYGDGHLWELWFPDTGDWNNYVWTDVSAVSGFGNMSGSPVVADSGSGGEVSVVLTKTSDSGLYTLDWSGSWSYRKVPVSSGSSTPIRTVNRVVGRRLPNGGRYLAGRGLSATDTQAGWVARRTGGWTDPYVLYRTLGSAGGVKGTPAIASNRVYVWSADPDAPLKGRTISASNSSPWWEMTSSTFCQHEGSPVVEPDSMSTDQRSLFMRAPDGSLIGFNEVGEPGDENYLKVCIGVAGPNVVLASAPEWVLGAQEPGTGPHARAAVYRGTNGSLYYHRNGVHAHLNVDVP